MWDLGLGLDLGVWLARKCGRGMGFLSLVFVSGFGKWVPCFGLSQIQNAFCFLLATKRRVEDAGCEALRGGVTGFVDHMNAF